MTVENPRRALGVVFFIVFIDLLGFGILIPVIPLYALSFGATEFVGSLLIASYSAMQFLAAPFLGRLSDNRGRRPVLLLSLSGSVIAWLLFGLAGSLTVLFVARMLAGTMGGNIATAQAYIADITSAEDRAKGLGLLGAAFGLGFVFGPALGGFFASEPVIAAARNVLPAVVPVSEFSLPSFAAALITGLNLLVAFFVLPESRPPEVRNATPELDEGRKSRESRIEQLLSALRTHGLGTLVASFFLVSFAFSALESQFIFLTNEQYSYGATENAVILTYVGIVLAVVQGGLVGPLTDRFGEYRLAVGGAAIQVVTLAAVPFSPVFGSYLPDVGRVLPVGPTLLPGVLMLLAVMTPLSFGNALTNVSLNTLVSRSAGDEEQGGAFGLTQSAGSLARTFGPALAGGLYTGIGFWAPFVVGGVLMIPILVLLGRLDHRTIAATTA
ncbi:tetracycline resistance MFS efflux pump [Haloferax mediterranei ATCC 33500]|uniref:Arabinose efflux permease family protein n=1 Tax=Haloferax mediterranei (strain ATCC 33500 / DSM 1411 / JCM 8866 / NBRC 14739 / NCIMB 2177 / R-4) TaxID=523841 RepID=I3R3A0_HALMT|nr:tetracycline resistance MFS efflux pump [Haloferax mediterranei]AFK18710.2 arabinose efflux permease family protein [Haloferax mediterranei ATCC 33500]AHZ21921.1 MFS transporter [Haloferax mediterranei ATCC 33500]EMA03430.1 arabinose efflux permease family protein [Haloferax mediterranei ATCC 33500]MDX5988806.1 tetracycline resistance MFS efflux pump [Haloferax mediterranei ATCC 33500]QCQ75209.1 tetracycline resistance MFS efflux pump [Haloferax mediterranei ATCC 33500]